MTSGMCACVLSVLSFTSLVKSGGFEDFLCRDQDVGSILSIFISYLVCV